MLKIHMLNLDVSVLFVIIIIWLLMNILNRIYFKPVGKVIQDREHKTETDSRKLDSMTRGIEEKTVQIEKVLQDTRRESIHIREELVSKGEAVRDQLVLRARESSKALFDTKMEEMDQELHRVEERLTREIDRFSDLIKDTFL